MTIKLLLSLGLLASLLTAQSWAAVVCSDAVATPNSTPTDPQTVSYTVPSGSAQLLLLGVINRSGTPPTVNSVTYNSVSMTQVGTHVAQGSVSVDVFRLVAPTQGANNFSIDFSVAPLSLGTVAVTCSGVDQASPIRGNTQNNGTTQTITVDVSSALGDLVVDFVGSTDSPTNLTVDGSQTLLDEDVAEATTPFGSSYEAGASTVTMSWSGTSLENWVTNGVSIKPDLTPTRRRGF